jgi:hypothetical protein
MTQELAKQLKDAGFSVCTEKCYKIHAHLTDKESPCEYLPAGILSELIMACGDNFGALEQFDEGWVAGGYGKDGKGFKLEAEKSPEEAVAQLFLTLNVK